MAHVEESSRKRKMKFDAIELDMLVAEAVKHVHELRQRHLTLSRRNAIWEAVCDRVNAVGRTRRSVDEIKRRWQDLLRRTKQKIALAEDKPLSPIEQQVLMTFCQEQIGGLHGYETSEPGSAEQGDSSVGGHSPPSPHSTSQAQPTTTDTFAEPRGLAGDVMDEEFLQPLEDGLQDIAQEVRAVASVTRALRRDTRTIVAHTRQLVDALSGLTAAITALTRAIEGGVALVERSFNPGGHSPEQPRGGGGGGSALRTSQRNVRKRKKYT